MCFNCVFKLETMDRSCVHHVEFGVKNGDRCVENFMLQYQMKLIATRTTPLAKQWVLATGVVRFLFTEITTNDLEAIVKLQDPLVNLWFENGRTNSYDSVFNVSFEVGNIEKCMERLSKNGVRICHGLECRTTDEGSVWMATVQSCVGNIKHTLIQKNDDYTGVFLPGFVSVTDSEECNENISSKRVNYPQLSHIDHVTIATNIGTCKKILEWYEEHFGMSRFPLRR